MLLAMGLSEREASESVRFSFSVSNTEAEAARAADIVCGTAKALRGRASW